MKPSTPQIRKLINEAINNLAPLFEIPAQDIEKASQFTIKRILSTWPYQDHSKNVPAYSYLDNFFFFPLRNSDLKLFSEMHPNLDKQTIKEIFCIDSKFTIYHEAGHRLHSFVNPQIVEGFKQFLKTGKRPEHHHQLCEVVAEYGNKILNPRDYSLSPYKYCYEDILAIFNKFGASFLPRLARMSLDEAIELKLFKH